MGINIKSLLTEIREELEAADRERAGNNRETLFLLKELELELKVVVSERGTAKGGFDVKVLTLGAEGSVQKEAVQTVRIRYNVPDTAQNASVPGARAHSSSDLPETRAVEPLE